MLTKRKTDDPLVEGSCFTIMPFGGWFDRYYETVYRPAIESSGLVPTRADDLYRPGTIINDIWDYIKNAKLLLADLTGRNPNVLYELGLAHAIAKPAIIITEDIEDIPFDLRALRIIEYDKNAPNWGDALSKKISGAITEVLGAPSEAVLPTFLSVINDASKKRVTPHQKEIIELKQEVDLLRREFRRSYMPTAKSHRSIEEQEWIKEITEYTSRGWKRENMVEHMAAKGVPRDWLISIL